MLQFRQKSILDREIGVEKDTRGIRTFSAHIQHLITYNGLGMTLGRHQIKSNRIRRSVASRILILLQW